MNVLTIGAAFGILVLVFEKGLGEPGLESTQPILLCATAFGLSTDYAVFLLSRIMEARGRGLDDRAAVAEGLERTGRIVTAAALLFCIAIGAFATSELVVRPAARRRHGGRGGARRDDRPGLPRPEPDGAARPLELVGAGAARPAARAAAARRALARGRGGRRGLRAPGRGAAGTSAQPRGNGGIGPRRVGLERRPRRIPPGVASSRQDVDRRAEPRIAVDLRRRRSVPRRRAPSSSSSSLQRPAARRRAARRRARGPACRSRSPCGGTAPGG